MILFCVFSHKRLKMVAAGITGALFFVVVTILSNDEKNLTKIIGKIAKKLDENSPNINTLHKFKVAGESKVIAVVKVSKNSDLDRLINQLHSVTELTTDSQPIITYENFARNLGVPDELTTPSTVVLREDDNLYWLTVRADYFGNKTSELLSVWKATAQEYLAAIKSGAIRGIFYKNLVEREVQMLWHVSDFQQLDINAATCPLTMSFGSNIRPESKGLSFIGSYYEKD